jgi:hypothetical protein
MLEKAGVEVDLSFNINYLSRLLPLWGENKRQGRFHHRFRRKYERLFSDLKFKAKLKTYNAIIISTCAPNGFWRHEYDIEELKKICGTIPIVFHGVYYLGNTPYQIKQLKKNNDRLLNAMTGI